MDRIPIQIRYHTGIYLIGLLMLLYFGITNYILNGNQLEFIALKYYTTIHYIGYPLSFITFGAYLLILNYKFKLLSIPLFCITYAGWEISAQGLNIIHTSPNYYMFYVVIIIALASIPILKKRISIRLSPIILILYFLFGFHLSQINLYWNEALSEFLFCLLIFEGAKLK